MIENVIIMGAAGRDFHNFNVYFRDNGAYEVVAFTHLWWRADGPDIDPRGTDQRQIEAGRSRVVAEATLIVPGHGPAFRSASV